MELLKYINNLNDSSFLFGSFLLNIGVSVVILVIFAIFLNSNGDHESEEKAMGSTVAGFAMSLVAFAVTNGNLFVMIVVNIISSSVCLSIIKEEAIYMSSVIATAIPIFGIIWCISYFYFPSEEKQIHHQGIIYKCSECDFKNRNKSVVDNHIANNHSPYRKLIDKRNKANSLISRLNNDLKTNAKSIKELSNNNIDNIKKSILEDEKLKIIKLINKVSDIEKQCTILATRYESAERIAKRDRELGEINSESDKILGQVENEIKNFLKQSKEIYLTSN